MDIEPFGSQTSIQTMPENGYFPPVFLVDEGENILCIMGHTQKCETNVRQSSTIQGARRRRQAESQGGQREEWMRMEQTSNVCTRHKKRGNR